MAELEAMMALLLDYPNKVFREVKTMEGYLYILPSSSAVSLIVAENTTQNDKKGVRANWLRINLF